MKATRKRVQSIEPIVADVVNGWLKDYGCDYKLEQESLNSSIDNALSEYSSKTGGSGGNRPDAKLLLSTTNSLINVPVLIEYKGYKDKLVKLDSEGHVANRKKDGTFNAANIGGYAVNGAVHYANAILHYTSFTDVIAIGVTGYKTATDEINLQIGVYLVSKDNMGVGQEVGDFSDLSFLRAKNFDAFMERVADLSLSQEELDKIKLRREQDIQISLKKLNNDIYLSEKGLSETDRVYLVAASIIATIGIPGKVAPLTKSELNSSTEEGNSDGDIIVRKITAFLRTKGLPEAKRQLIVRTLENTLTTERINRPVNGESQLKRVFSEIVDTLGIYYKSGLTTDFTGALFNEMYSWMGFSQDKLNDVVLTPSNVATLLVKLARVNRNSYVWDFATGSAGLLVAAMNEMLIDARENIKSIDEFRIKAAHIKAEQLLGIELLSNVYMLAILNMLMMGDGSSNILNEDSLTHFDGSYQYSKEGEKFPATAFVLNPPYSEKGNGMVFVEKALKMMDSGYAAIIIQGSAGSGKAEEYNTSILRQSTLLASIKMPPDLFVGKSNVQTYIYVFRVGEPHHKDDVVKFIDFTFDGYARGNRRKAKTNLINLGDAEQRYQEVVDLVQFGKHKLHLLSESEYYEGHIDPKDGTDWNQIAPVTEPPTFQDLHAVTGNYISWGIERFISKPITGSESGIPGPDIPIAEFYSELDWEPVKLQELFTVESNPQLDKKHFRFSSDGKYPYFTRTVENNGVSGMVDFLDDKHKIPGGRLAVGMMGMRFFYMESDFYAGQFTKSIVPKGFHLNKDSSHFFITSLNAFDGTFKNVLVREFKKTFDETTILVPKKDGKLDITSIETIGAASRNLVSQRVLSFLEQSGHIEKRDDSYFIV